MQKVNKKIYVAPTDIAVHNSCKHATKLELERACGHLDLILYPDPFVDALQEKGIRFEREYLVAELDKGKTVAQIGGNPNDHRITVYDNIQTALNAQPDIIYQATLEYEVTDDIIIKGNADFIEKQPDGSYIIVDTKFARETKAVSIIQIATYSELLRYLTGIKPELMAIQKPNGERDEYRYDDVSAVYSSIKLDVISTIEQFRSDSAGKDGDRVYEDIVPEPCDHCSICKFNSICDEQRRNASHLSLVAGMTTDYTEVFESEGMSTYDEAAQAQLPFPFTQGMKIKTKEQVEKLIKQAQLQKESEAGVIVREFLPIEVNRGLNMLPEPHVDDLYLDFEYDQMIGDRGLAYVTGWRCKGVYTYHWANNDEEERAAFLALIEKLKSITNWNPQAQYFDESPMPEHTDMKYVDCTILYTGPHIFAYSHAESTNIRRLSEKYGQEEFCKFLTDAHVIVDLRKIIKESMQIGIEGYGLKELEEYIAQEKGFQRNVPLDRAIKHRISIEVHLEKGEVDEIDQCSVQNGGVIENSKDFVIRYNDDDCRSLEYIQKMLEEDFSQLNAQGLVQRPVLTIKRKNIHHVEYQDEPLLSELLEAFSPTILVSPTEVQKLLFSTLEFFKKEAIADWIQNIELREGDPFVVYKNELVLGYPIGNPEYDSGEKTMKLTFEKQECDFVGDRFTTYEGNREFKGTLLEVEYSPCGNYMSAIFKLHKDFTFDNPPSEIPMMFLYDGEYIKIDDKKERLLQIINMYKQLKMDGQQIQVEFPLALQFLEKQATQYNIDINTVLNSGDTAAEELCKRVEHMNDSLLCLQGPPGTGKSYCIKMLVSHILSKNPDAKIAITANAHAVLLEIAGKIIEQLKRDGVSATIRQKLPKDKITIGSTTFNGQGYSISYEQYDSKIEPGYNDEKVGVIPFPNITIGSTFMFAKKHHHQAYDYMIIEEAGQLTIVDTLIMCDVAKNLIMVGDQNQLQSPIKAKNHYGAEISGLQYYIDGKIVTPEKGVFISETRRMHPDVCDFVSTLFYERRLSGIPFLQQRAITSENHDLYTGSGLRLIEVDHVGQKTKSEAEVDRIIDIVTDVFNPLNQYKYSDENGTRNITISDMIIITPFNNQRKLIKKRLKALQDSAMQSIQMGTVTLAEEYDNIERRLNELKEQADNLRVYTERRDDAIARQVQRTITLNQNRINSIHTDYPNLIQDLASTKQQYDDIREEYGHLLFGEIRCGSVDSFQGKEAAIVLYSTVASDIESAPRGMSFIFSPYRINVAVSRAKALFIMIASPKLFDVRCKTPEQIKLANAFYHFKDCATKIQ